MSPKSIGRLKLGLKVSEKISPKLSELLTVENVVYRKILKSEAVIRESIQFLKRENIYE